jgi:RimJ/RimL family protein N-acetyltransferase
MPYTFALDFENEELTQPLQLETQRLTLRRWQEADRAPFAQMNADPIVMHYFGAVMTRTESDEAIDRYLAAFDREGFSFFAAHLRDTRDFIGTIGMQTMRDAVPNLSQPAVEIGWRLTQAAQGHGLATEGARTIVDFAFNKLGLNEVVAITALPNSASRHVMEKLGMTHRPELDFDHPRRPPVPAPHSLQRSKFPRGAMLEPFVALISERLRCLAELAIVSVMFISLTGCKDKPVDAKDCAGTYELHYGNNAQGTTCFELRNDGTYTRGDGFGKEDDISISGMEKNGLWTLNETGPYQQIFIGHSALPINYTHSSIRITFNDDLGKYCDLSIHK